MPMIILARNVSRRKYGIRVSEPAIGAIAGRIPGDA
jgi:hypothetical protein